MSKSNEAFSISESVEKLKSVKYFIPSRTIEEANAILTKVNELIENYIKDLSTWKRGNDTLQHAGDSLWGIARIAAMKADRPNTWDSAWDCAWKQASYSARDNYGWYGGGYPQERQQEMLQGTRQNVLRDLSHLNLQRTNLGVQTHLAILSSFMR